MSGREQTDAAEERVLAGDHTHNDIERQVMKRLFDVDAKPQVRFGRYEVTGRLGQGAMGTVYEARDPELDRLVAIKVLHGTIAETERTALIAEARAMARLHHPNVVAVYDVGEQDGQVFIAMERVLGTSLRAWAEKHKPQWRAAATVYREAARGLAAAHAAGVAHRDFKPDNVMVAKDGRVAVADFGLASRGRHWPTTQDGG
ncbi:MAG: serine/threonine protein kinase [Nannocystaceae bacterium]|nr:serine/threonine protein kinase [Nannocystaceae bacterium]